MEENSSNNVKVIKIKIAEKNYSLKVKSGEEENYYYDLATYVDQTIKRIKMHAPVDDFKNLLLLACLTLADEILSNPNSNFNFINQNKFQQNLFKERLTKILSKIKSYQQDN